MFTHEDTSLVASCGDVSSTKEHWLLFLSATVFKHCVCALVMHARKDREVLVQHAQSLKTQQQTKGR